ncbi:MAG: hypothetical protein NXI00_02975 [Cytophagales bacterium]|nr:hypothetical protein [Cytophagales bacterium]
MEGAENEPIFEAFNKEMPNGNGFFFTTLKNDDSQKSAIKEDSQKLFKNSFLTPGKPATLPYSNGPANPTIFLGKVKELREIRNRLNKHG